MSMSVLQIIPGMGTGGAEQACQDMAHALILRGDRAMVVSKGGYRVPALDEMGTVHITHDVGTKNPFKIYKNAKWLADLIREKKIDMVHVRSRAPAWSALLACRWTKCPFITTFHAAYRIYPKIKQFYNTSMTRSDVVIAISDFIKRHLEQDYGVDPSKIRLINRGINLDFFDRNAVTPDRVDALRQAWGVDTSRPVVMLPGRRSRNKNHHLMISAIKILKERGLSPLPVIYCVGDDQGRAAYTQELLDRIAKEGLEKDIKLIGACKDMPAALVLADVSVMPSTIAEGFGRIPVEAMAMGTLTISSDRGAPLDTVLEGQTGWLLPPDDAEKWANAIQHALGLPQETRDEMAKLSRARAEQFFSAKDMIAKTLDVYDEVYKKFVKDPS